MWIQVSDYDLSGLSFGRLDETRRNHLRSAHLGRRGVSTLWVSQGDIPQPADLTAVNSKMPLARAINFTIPSV
jgi:hypothetical protein